MFDVYLGGILSKTWRKTFKEQIDKKNSIFDPYVKNFLKSDNFEKSEQIAREFYFIDQSKIIVFYFNSSLSKSSRVQLGDATGRGKQVIVCLDGRVPGCVYIERYCEYRGIFIVYSIEELVQTVNECLEQVKLCQFLKD